MMTDESLFTYALLVSTLLLLGAATIAILRFQRLVRKSAHLLAQPAETGPRQNPSGNAELELRMEALQKLVEDLARKEKPQANGRRDLPYEHAVRMARSGAGVDELTRNCGLRKGEAELLLRLHGNRQPAKPSSIH